MSYQSLCVILQKPLCIQYAKEIKSDKVKWYSVCLMYRWQVMAEDSGIFTEHLVIAVKILIEYEKIY